MNYLNNDIFWFKKYKKINESKALSKRAKDLYKNSFEHFVKEDELYKALKINKMLRNLFVFNVLSFDDGKLHFCNSYKNTLDLNQFFYLIIQCDNSNPYDSLILALTLYSDNKSLLDKKEAINSFEIKPAIFHFRLDDYAKNKSILLNSSQSSEFLLLYYILLPDVEKKAVFANITKALNKSFAKKSSNSEGGQISIEGEQEKSTTIVSKNSKTINMPQSSYPKIVQARRNVNPFNLNPMQLLELKEQIEKSHLHETTFAQDVIDYCYKQGIVRGVDFENETLINQNEYSKLKNNYEHIPDKRICVSICVGLRLTLDESFALLKKAGYTLSSHIPFDNFIIDNSLNPRFYDIEQLNELLEQTTIKERIGSVQRGAYNKS